MSINSKTADLEKNSFDSDSFRKAVITFKTSDIEILIDWYGMYDGTAFKNQIKALKEELEFRKSLLGKELE